MLAMKVTKIIEKLMKSHDGQTGFTLVELVIALSVFTVGIMATFTLSLANVNTADENYQDILAANLAREGIELVRNIRDTNWLRMEANDDCDLNTPGTQICSWNHGLDWGISKVQYNSSALAEVTGNIPDCYNNNTCRLYRTANNFYTHDQTAPNSATNLARVIYLTALCMDYDNTGAIIVSDGLACSQPSERFIGLEVISRVRWYRGNHNRDYTVVDRIYNWQDYAD